MQYTAWWNYSQQYCIAYLQIPKRADFKSSHNKKLKKNARSVKQ